MAVNTRTDYALRAILEIPCKGEGTISAQKICESQKLPKKYVEHLLNSLKAAGLIQSFAGSRGGYTLSRHETEITLWDVMQAVEDSSPEMSCSMDGNFCLGVNCGLNLLFAEISQHQRELFRGYTLEKIRQIARGVCK